MQAQSELDGWVAQYNSEREHQAIGDVPSIRRFELVQRSDAEVIDRQIKPVEEATPPGTGTRVLRLHKQDRMHV